MHRTARFAARRMRTTIRVLLSDFRFFGSLALHLPLVADAGVKDVASDGEDIYFNPEWVAQAGADDLRGLVSGVVLSCALKHHLRRGERDYDMWQGASFLARLPILKAASLDVDVPSGLQTAAMMAQKEMTAEQWYDLIESMPKSDKPKDGDSGTGGSGGQGMSQPQAGQPPQNGKGGEGGQGQSGQDQQQQDQQQGQGGSQQGDGQGGQSQYQGGTGEVKDSPKSESEGGSQKQIDREERKWDKMTHQAVALDKSAGQAIMDVSRIFGDSHEPKQP